MDINGISTYTNAVSTYSNARATTAEPSKKAPAATGDGFTSEPTVTTDAGTYNPTTLVTDKTAQTVGETKEAEKTTENSEETEEGKFYTYDAETVNRLLAESEDKITQFKNLLKMLLGKQNEKAEIGQLPVEGNENYNLTVDDEGNIVFSEEALKEVGLDEFDEDGYWGAEQTAQRIFDMAVAFAGTNQSLLGTMKDSIAKAFSECEEIFGGEGKLADVSYKTRDRIDELFAEYEGKLNGTTTKTTEEVDAGEKTEA